MNGSMPVAVLGASSNPDRYANMAVRMLKRAGFRVIPVNPRETDIEGLTAVSRLSDIHEPVHTLTLYVGPLRCRALVDEIVALNPARVIFNPGTEFDELEKRLEAAGIPAVKACTLVMIQSGQF
ncbi:MAG TPA: CoA-binding protein [bacterium]|nr:CoA-binding protein [bacterium]